MSLHDDALTVQEQAEAIALKAKAVIRCDLHDEVLIDQYDSDANKYAYALGTNLWKTGDIPCERQDFLEAIKEIIEGSAYDCPECEKLKNE